MKIRITMKDPDGVYGCIRENLQPEVDLIKGLSEKERENWLKSKTAYVHEALSKWIRYGEYITIEFDTDTEKACVIPN